MKRILVLFPNEWDLEEFSRDKYASQFEFIYEGKNFFKLPQALSLPFFNTRRFVQKMLRNIKRQNIEAVLSSDEYLGAILAAIIAKEAGLPGTEPTLILSAQHKYYSRLSQQQHCPEASVYCDLVPQHIPRDFKPALSFPFFVKPVKGTFSLFAKKVSNLKELRKHMAFNWYERLLLKTITRPFNQLLKDHTSLDKNANYFVAEELIEGSQVTVDGFVENGEVRICGIVDSVMFPNTNIFERFEYPSRLPHQVQERMNTTVEQLMTGIGFQHAQFNVELFYNEALDEIHIIEINPRLSYQFSDLYENVDGTSTYQILLGLALGQPPKFTKGAGDFNCTASFVLRTFEGKTLESTPDARHIKAFNSRYNESNVKVYGKKGTKLSSEMRAIGSYRYGIVNVGAHSLLDLFSIYEDAIDSLPFSFK